MRYQTWHPDWKQLVQEDAFNRDASAVAKTSAPELEKVIETLDATSGFLGPRHLRALVGSVLTDAEQARGVASFIRNMDALQRHTGESFQKDFIGDFVQHSPLTQEEKKKISDVLSRLLRKRPALVRHHKAEDLAKRIGASLQHFSITCDLRPVFDDARESIEGMFPVATLKVDVTEGFVPVTLIAQVSGTQIERILEEATNAHKKVASLRRFLAERGVVVPEAGVEAMTDDGGDEEDDGEDEEEDGGVA